MLHTVSSKGGTLLVSLLPFISSALAQYQQVDRWAGDNFFNGFDFFTGADPTQGFVNFVDQGTAQNNGLISTAGAQVYMGVDYTTSLAADGSQGGRQSVRLESKKSYTRGLFILDAAHMPGGVCGTWPAWWTFGPNWPNQGEIDIIEGVNSQTSNLMSLHTSDNCRTTGAGETGQLVTGDCYQYDPAQSNSGCGVSNTAANVYGSGFNSIGGGVYAMEWTSTSIRIWFFPRGGIPGDISAGTPNPSAWGTPAANHATACDINSHFSDHKVIFDTTFCGQWGGAVFASDPVCGSRAGGNCQAYVAGAPGDFKEAYWAINYMAVYQSPTAAAAAVELPMNIALPEQEPDAALAAGVVNAAQGNAVGAVPGVTPPAKVAPKELDQVPATANATVANRRRAVETLFA